MGLVNALLVNRLQIVLSTNDENDDKYMSNPDSLSWSAVMEQNMENTDCRKQWVSGNFNRFSRPLDITGHVIHKKCVIITYTYGIIFPRIGQPLGSLVTGDGNFVLVYNISAKHLTKPDIK